MRDFILTMEEQSADIDLYRTGTPSLSLSSDESQPSIRPVRPVSLFDRPDISLFGKWVEVFCAILDCTNQDIARNCSLDQSTITKCTTNTTKPQAKTVVIIWQTLMDMLADLATITDEEREDLASCKAVFFNAAGIVLEEQKEKSERDVDELREGIFAQLEEEGKPLNYFGLHKRARRSNG